VPKLEVRPWPKQAAPRSNTASSFTLRFPSFRSSWPGRGPGDPRRRHLGADGRFLKSIGAEPSGEVCAHLSQVNGGPGVVITSRGEPVSALVPDVAGGLVQTIHLVANPEKLAGVRAVSTP
jgi:hypothetical protein